MKQFILILSIILSGFAATAQQIDKKQLVQKLEKTPILIDIRSTEEYKEGTIPGAMNLNFHEEEFKNFIMNISKDKEIIVFCQTGFTSNEAIERLKAEGFANVTQLEGGYEKWIEEAPAVKQK
ncbi:rhodanese-like domain-containing protein [Myroides sp. JBRI-B21084]|uniref:rhodanese-like domain-containing protein n=1 Tax=Myroides sp. JBRI-B21084 TaxID=3119977 RepID=UPI0026E2C792|nr:rhodanese-like domain-containing protein [Paenimyroides cloacae]WKW45707.1 rhodanese-like domain-containing protein [Paenimyroides cloacae]